MTPGIVLDLVLVAVMVVWGVSGWRRGALAAVLGVAGVIGGGWFGLWIGPKLLELLPELAGQRGFRLIALTAMFLAGVGIGSKLAAILHNKVGSDEPARGIDAALGAVANVFVVVIASWFFIVAVRPFATPTVQSAIDGSRIHATIDSFIPEQFSELATRTVQDLVAHLPVVFGGVDPVLPTEESDAGIVNDPQVLGVAASVVEVATRSPACASDSTGSGWVVSPGRVVTNAHVVAGSRSLTVARATGGGALSATVVALDPDLDVAVLAVDGLDAPALPRAPQPLAAGADAVAAGFPWGGPYHLSPGRIRGTLVEQSTDIYGGEGVAREIYAVRGTVRPGNSGGPLVDTDGHVIGTVFAMSLSDPETGYALTDAATATLLDQAPSLTREVDTGDCPAG